MMTAASCNVRARVANAERRAAPDETMDRG
jgi:hypothetical protein